MRATSRSCLRSCEIDRGHATAAELALKHITVGKVRLELIARIAHPGTWVVEERPPKHSWAGGPLLPASLAPLAQPPTCAATCAVT